MEGALTTSESKRFSEKEVNEFVEKIEETLEVGKDPSSLARRGINAPLTSRTETTGASLLHVACSKGSLPVVEFLLNSGLSVADSDDNWDTPLHFAARHAQVAVVKTLLDKGARMNVRGHEGNTPIHCAVLSGSTKMVEFLCQQPGSNVNVKNYRGDGPIHLASKAGSLGCLQQLLSNHAEVNSHNNNWETPLHLAAQSGHDTCINTLLRAEPEKDPQNKNGKTPLFVSVEAGKKISVALLLQAGHNPSIADKSGKTPLQRAEEIGDDDMASFLEQFQSGEKSKNRSSVEFILQTLDDAKERQKSKYRSSPAPLGQTKTILGERDSNKIPQSPTMARAAIEKKLLEAGIQDLQTERQTLARRSPTLSRVRDEDSKTRLPPKTSVGFSPKVLTPISSRNARSSRPVTPLRSESPANRTVSPMRASLLPSRENTPQKQRESSIGGEGDANLRTSERQLLKVAMDRAARSDDKLNNEELRVQKLEKELMMEKKYKKLLEEGFEREKKLRESAEHEVENLREALAEETTLRRKAEAALQREVHSIRNAETQLLDEIESNNSSVFELQKERERRLEVERRLEDLTLQLTTAEQRVQELLNPNISGIRLQLRDEVARRSLAERKLKRERYWSFAKAARHWVQGWRMLSVAGCWREWRSYDRVAILRQQAGGTGLKRVLLALVQKNMLHAFNVWRQFTAVEAAEEHTSRRVSMTMEQMIQDAQKAQMRSVMQGVFNRWTNLQLTSSWVRWKDFVSQTEKQNEKMRGIMTRALRRWANLNLSAAVNQFKANMFAARKEEADLQLMQKEKMKSSMKMILNRWVHSKLVGAFNRFKLLTKVERKQEGARSTFNRIIRQLVFNGLHHGLTKWKEFSKAQADAVATEKQLKAAGTFFYKTLVQLQQRHTLSAMRKWASFVKLKQEEDRNRLQVQANNHIVYNTLRGWKDRHLRHGWQGWRVFMHIDIMMQDRKALLQQQHERAMKLFLAVIKRLENREMHRGWNSMKGLVASQKKKERQLLRVHKQLRNLFLHRSFGKLRLGVANFVGKRADGDVQMKSYEIQNLHEQISRLHQQLELAEVENSNYRSTIPVKDQTSGRQRLGTLLRNFHNISMSRAFNTWKTTLLVKDIAYSLSKSLRESKEEKYGFSVRSLGRCLQRLVDGAQKEMLLRWVDYALNHQKTEVETAVLNNKKTIFLALKFASQSSRKDKLMQLIELQRDEVEKRCVELATLKKSVNIDGSISEVENAGRFGTNLLSNQRTPWKALVQDVQSLSSRFASAGDHNHELSTRLMKELEDSYEEIDSLREILRAQFAGMTLEKVLVDLKYRGMRAYIYRWKKWIAGGENLDRALLKMILALTRKHESKAFRTWLGFARIDARGALAIGAARLFMRLLARWKSIRLFPPFQTWRDEVSRLQRTERVFVQAHRALLNQSLLRGWNKWISVCRGDRGRNTGASLFLRLLKRWSQGLLGQAFQKLRLHSSWMTRRLVEYSRQSDLKQSSARMLTGVMRRMKNVALSRAFNTIRGETRRLSYRERCFRRVSLQWQNRHLGRAFNSFKLLVITSEKSIEELKRRLADEREAVKLLAEELRTEREWREKERQTLSELEREVAKYRSSHQQSQEGKQKAEAGMEFERNVRMMGLKELQEAREAKERAERELQREREMRIVVESDVDKERNIKGAIEAQFSRLREEKQQLAAALAEETELRIKIESEIDNERTARSHAEEMARIEKELREMALSHIEQERRQKAEMENELTRVHKLRADDESKLVDKMASLKSLFGRPVATENDYIEKLNKSHDAYEEILQQSVSRKNEEIERLQKRVRNLESGQQ